MTCKFCGSDNLSKFEAEVMIHFPKLKNIHKPTVMVFPDLLICLDCGIVEFTVAKTELGRLAKGDAAASG